MKILFIAHYYHPEPGFFFAHPFALALKERGHQVEVITGYPNYPAGKLQDGYRQKLKMVEWIDGIKVIRVPLFISHDRSSLRRIISYISLSFMQLLVGTFCRFDADIAFVSQGPATIGLPAIWFKFFKKIPFVFQIQDLWPDSLAASGMFSNRLGLKMVHWWCKMVYRQACHIAVIAPGMKKALVERGVPEDKISLVYNCGNVTDKGVAKVLPSRLEAILSSKKFTILYAGNFGVMQRLQTVVEAASLLQSYEDIQFVLVGNGVEKEKLEKEVEAQGLTNIKFHPFISSAEADLAIQKSCAVLAHLQQNPLFDMTIPSKVQKYLYMGKPIIIAVGHDAADLVVNLAQAGVAAEPENPKSLANAVLNLYRMPEEKRKELGENGARFFEEHLTFVQWVDCYEKMFNKIVENKPVRRM